MENTFEEGASEVVSQVANLFMAFPCWVLTSILDQLIDMFKRNWYQTTLFVHINVGFEEDVDFIYLQLLMIVG